jgi:outer membrane protein assembly factor BamB
VVFAAGADHFVTVEAPTGQTKWEVEIDPGTHPSPAISSDRVFVCGEDGYLHALGIVNGQRRWRFPRRGAMGDKFSSPIVAGDIIYVRSNSDLYTVEAKTGVKRWRYPTGT